MGPGICGVLPRKPRGLECTMRFQDDILAWLKTNADASSRDAAHSLFLEIAMAYDQGGLGPVEQLLREKQSAIQERFDDKLQNLDQII